MQLLNKDRKKKTFRQKKPQKGERLEPLFIKAEASLGISANLRTAVPLPPGEDLNEWLAVHTIDFFNQTNLLFGSIEEFVDEESFPEMTAGPQYVYLWADDKTKKPTSVPARKYVDLLFTWIQSKFDDENIFPTSVDKPFPKDFRQIISKIYSRLFRVFAHIYVHHFHRIQELEEEAHLNAVFKHFLFFIDEFELVDKRELAPLQALIEKFLKKEKE